nr:hypothetical protein [uncultured Mediterranean phage uvMED]
MALVKYNNNSISAVTSAASIPSGAMTHIKTLTASSSSTLSFVDGSSDVVLDSTYPIYVFKFINIHPATDSTHFQFNMSVDGGSNYNVTKTSTMFRAWHKEDDSAYALAYDAGYDLAQSTAFQPLAQEVSNDNDNDCVGTLTIYNPSSTTFVKHFISTLNMVNAEPITMIMYGAGYGNTTSAVDAIRFKMSSGDIDSGKIKLYGIKDS